MHQIRLLVSDDNVNDKIFVCGGPVKDGYTKVDFICPLTGKAFKIRKKFWIHIESLKLDPLIMKYDRQLNVENEDNISKLFDKTHFKYLWVKYFEKKKNNKLLENLVGQINLELYIILLKVYKGEMDTDKVISGTDDGISEAVTTTGNADVETVDVEVVVDNDIDGADVDTGDVDTGDVDEVVDTGDVDDEVVTGDVDDEVVTGDVDDEVVTGNVDDEVVTGDVDDEVVTGNVDDEVVTGDVVTGDKDTAYINKLDMLPDKIYNMDCYDYLCKLPDKHIDSIILDPPYYEVVKEDWDNQWSTFNDYLEWFTPIIKELSRVSKYSCSCFVFGFPHQLSYLLPLFEKAGFKYRQYICVSKGLQAVAGRTSQKLKMFPTASEYILYFYKDATTIIKTMLQDKQKASGLSGNDINKYLGKASNGGGTWSTIAGKRQLNIQNPTREDWHKLESLFGGFDIKYDDYVYKFNLPNGLTDVWTDINFSDRKYKKLWNKKYNEKCSHPTMKPYPLIKRLIDCSTVEGDIVLDIFMGTGMTGLVCKDTNRRFMGCELDSKFVDKSLIHL